MIYIVLLFITIYNIYCLTCLTRKNKEREGDKLQNDHKEKEVGKPTSCELDHRREVELNSSNYLNVD